MIKKSLFYFLFFFSTLTLVSKGGLNNELYIKQQSLISNHATSVHKAQVVNFLHFFDVVNESEDDFNEDKIVVFSKSNIEFNQFQFSSKNINLSKISSRNLFSWCYQRIPIFISILNFRL